MIPLFYAFKDNVIDVTSVINDEIIKKENYDGLSIEGEITPSIRDVTVSPLLCCGSYKLKEDVCDKAYTFDIGNEKFRKMAGQDKREEEEVNIFSKPRVIPFKSPKNVIHGFPGTVFLNIKFNLGFHDYYQLSEILRELRNKTAHSLILANQNIDRLYRLRDSIKPQIQIAAFDNRAYGDMPNPPEVDYLVYDLAAAERYEESRLKSPSWSIEPEAKLENYIFNEVCMEDSPEMIAFGEEMLDGNKIIVGDYFNQVMLFEALLKKQRGILPLKSMLQLVNAIAIRKLKQAKEALQQGKKIVIILPEDYESYLSELSKLGKEDKLIIATRNPVLSKSL